MDGGPGGLQSMGSLESDTTERLHFHFSLSCIGEGGGNPLQCSCLETPRDGEAWWAAVYGVAQSRTQLKRLSSSSIHHFNVEVFHLLERLFFVCCVGILVKNQLTISVWIYLWTLSLFHWSTCLGLYQYYSVLIAGLCSKFWNWNM